MQLKKNVFANTIGLLLETSAKKKNTLKLRQYSVAMKISDDLHPVNEGNGRYELSPASYNLTHDEKRQCARAYEGSKSQVVSPRT